ncbi:hypothetical protein Tco_1368594 [Tanacetum coccineum]
MGVTRRLSLTCGIGAGLLDGLIDSQHVVSEQNMEVSRTVVRLLVIILYTLSAASPFFMLLCFWFGVRMFEGAATATIPQDPISAAIDVTAARYKEAADTTNEYGSDGCYGTRVSGFMDASVCV